MDGPKAIDHFPSDKDQTVIEYIGDDSKYGIESAPTVLAPRDGLVREMKTKKVISREEIQERTETEDVKHLGDFSDEVSLANSHFVKLLILIICKHTHTPIQYNKILSVKTQLQLFREFCIAGIFRLKKCIEIKIQTATTITITVEVMNWNISIMSTYLTMI